MNVLRLVGALLPCLAASVACAQASFTWLPAAPRPDGTTVDLQGAYGFSISDDGATVAGHSSRGLGLGAPYATVWRRGSDGAYSGQTLPRLPSPAPPLFPWWATDVSADGSRVAGARFTGGFAWDVGSGSYLPGVLQWSNPHVRDPGAGPFNTGLRAMSSDGRFGVNESYFERVNLDTGTLMSLPLPTGISNWDYLEGSMIARNGSVMAGYAEHEDAAGNHSYLWRWQDGAGTQALEVSFGNVLMPQQVLDDGSVLVPLADGMGGYQVGRWMPEGALVETGIHAPLFACSADGSLLAGGNEVWTQATGTVSLESFLGPGVLPSGYSFHVDAVSANGQYWIVNASDLTGAFDVSGIVTVPAPGSIGGVALGCLAFGRRHRRSNRA